MGFDAGKAVTTLDWNFAPYTTAAGVTPEPSQQQVDDFLAVLRATREGLVDDQGAVDRDKLAVMVQEMGGEQELSAAVTDRVLTAAAALCSQSPSHPDLTALRETAPRVLQAYLGYLTGTFLTPQ